MPLCPDCVNLLCNVFFQCTVEAIVKVAYICILMHVCTYVGTQVIGSSVGIRYIGTYVGTYIHTYVHRYVGT